MAAFIHCGTPTVLLISRPRMTAKNTGSSPSSLKNGTAAKSCAPKVSRNITSSERNIPLSGRRRAAEVAYVRIRMNTNMYRAESQLSAVPMVLGICGIEEGNAAARARMTAPAMTMIQSSDVNCLSHFFISVEF